jgi:hypothetical protein
MHFLTTNPTMLCLSSIINAHIQFEVGRALWLHHDRGCSRRRAPCACPLRVWQVSEQAVVQAASSEQAQDEELLAAMGPDILPTNQQHIYLALLKVRPAPATGVRMPAAGLAAWLQGNADDVYAERLHALVRGCTLLLNQSCAWFSACPFPAMLCFITAHIYTCAAPLLP